MNAITQSCQNPQTREKPGTKRPVARVKCFALYWAPEGKCIATVSAQSESAAIRKAPKPYRKYPGEIYAVAMGDSEQ